MIALQYSGSDRIRTLNISYSGAFHLFLLSLIVLFLPVFFLLPSANNDSLPGGLGRNERTEGIDSERTGEALDETQLRLHFIQEWSQMKGGTERLLENVVWIRRLQIASPDHSRYLEKGENEPATLNAVRQEARRQEVFVPLRYLRRRLLSNYPLVNVSRDFAGFYNQYLFPLPYRSPMQVSSLTVNSAFGFRKNPFGGRGPLEHHRGVDFKAVVGTDIIAAARGEVIKVRHDRRGYGNWILIRHPGNYQTLYAHLEKILVEEGEFVRAGQPVGKSGRSGTVTGPHLHYEIRIGGKPQDPEKFLPR